MKHMNFYKRRWSKLQKALYAFIDPDLDFQIHCSVYRMQSADGSHDLPRYWITLGDDTLFDYPRQFLSQRIINDVEKGKMSRWRLGEIYPYLTNISNISALIREYIDTPKERLLDKHFKTDYWGLVNILRAADRRMGTRRLQALRRKTRNYAARKILALRLSKNESFDNNSES